MEFLNNSIDFIKNNVVYIIVVILSSLLIIYGESNYHTNSRYYLDLLTKESDLKFKISELEKQNEAKIKESIKDLSGFSVERKMNDDEIATEFVKLCTTWNSSESYHKNRQTLIDKYKKGNELFFELMFPEVKDKVTEFHGHKFGLDLFEFFKVNLTFESFETFCVGIKDDTYSYIGLCRVTSNAYNTLGYSYIIFQYDVTKNYIHNVVANDVTNLSGLSSNDLE